MKRNALSVVLLAAMASPTASKPALTLTREEPSAPRFGGEFFRFPTLRRRLLGLSVLLSLASAAPPAVAEGETVNELRQAGWVVIEKQGRIERRPGLPPYETMSRAVQVTTFVMEKGARRKVCTLAYDSQLDTFAEECRDAE